MTKDSFLFKQIITIALRVDFWNEIIKFILMQLWEYFHKCFYIVLIPYARIPIIIVLNHFQGWKEFAFKETKIDIRKLMIKFENTWKTGNEYFSNIKKKLI